MTGFSSTFVLALLSSVADAAMRVHPGEAGLYPDRDANTKCEELCKVDSGMDADARDCMTECATATDLTTHHMDDGMRYFAEDESFNEKGGNKIQDLHNEKAPAEVPDCVPTVDLTKTPSFDEIDTHGDGVIDAEESEEWASKACIPDEMNTQIFQEADLNQDHVIDKEEFGKAGEWSKNEQIMDKALEKVSEGDDEYNTVQNPPLEEFDADKDGALDKDEANHMFEHELERRTEHEPVPEDKMKEIEPDIQDAVDKVDTNDDGEIDADEYVAKGEDNDLGTELKEAADAGEDAKELDDLARADKGEPAPAAGSGASFAQRQPRRDAAFLPKRKARKYGTALQQIAAAQAEAKQWLREAHNLRKQAALLRLESRVNRRNH